MKLVKEASSEALKNLNPCAGSCIKENWSNTSIPIREQSMWSPGSLSQTLRVSVFTHLLQL
jgi:hypothetical protein